MWKQYRKTFIPIQLMIFTICLIADFVVRLPALTVMIYFVVMELFSVLGAMWAVRLQNKIAMQKRRREGLSDSLL